MDPSESKISIVVTNDGGGGDDDSDDRDKEKQQKDKEKKRKKEYTVRQHEFVLYTYKSFTWCDFCNQFIWGLARQGYRCTLCHFDCHSYCVEQVTVTCTKTIRQKPKNPPTTTTSLTTTALASKSDDPGASSDTEDKASINSSDGGSSATGEKKKFSTIAKIAKRKAIETLFGEPEEHIFVNKHEFVHYTYKSPAWCYHCNNFIWGLQRQGWRCKYCHINSHSRCVQRVVLPCRPKKSRPTDGSSDTGSSVVSRSSSRTLGTSPACMIEHVDGWVIEDGFAGRMFDEIDGANMAPENSEETEAWYSQYFVNAEHDLFIGLNEEEEPFVLSIVREKEIQDGDEFYQYRTIVWLKTGKEQTVIPVLYNDVLNADHVLDVVYPEAGASLRTLTRGSNEFNDLAKELVTMEKEQCAQDFKFGVLYMKSGQKNQDDMFGNENGSKRFNRFLGILGDKITLKGWSKFRGGLNVESNITGEQSYYTEFNNCNIMFHVSTLLPFSSTDPQQLERKRHIGNDIVCIVFQDGGSISFSPTWISSQFIHTFIVVNVEKQNEKKQYRVNVTTNEFVPPYGPDLPNPPIFSKERDLHDFLLTKCINAEKAAYLAPAFQARRLRTLKGFLEYIHTKFQTEGKVRKRTSVRLDSAATLSPMAAKKSPRESQKKENGE